MGPAETRLWARQKAADGLIEVRGGAAEEEEGAETRSFLALRVQAHREDSPAALTENPVGGARQRGEDVRAFGSPWQCIWIDQRASK